MSALSVQLPRSMTMVIFHHRSYAIIQWHAMVAESYPGQVQPFTGYIEANHWTVGGKSGVSEWKLISTSYTRGGFVYLSLHVFLAKIYPPLDFIYTSSFLNFEHVSEHKFPKF